MIIVEIIVCFVIIMLGFYFGLHWERSKTIPKEITKDQYMIRPRIEGWFSLHRREGTGWNYLEDYNTREEAEVVMKNLIDGVKFYDKYGELIK